jgi:hypothetical protein
MTDCQELPVGDYSTIAITGVAGNVVYTKDARSETGWNLALPDDNRDGEADPFAVAGVGQLWLHPNDLGSTAALADYFTADEEDRTKREKLAEKVVLKGQSLSSAFKVRDPDIENDVRPLVPDDEQIFMDVDGTEKVLGDCDQASVPGATAAITPIVFGSFEDRNGSGGTSDERAEWIEQCCPRTITDRCDLPLCEAREDGTREPVLLKAWIAPGAGVSPTKYGKNTAQIEGLPQMDISLAGAAALTRQEKTAFFRGRFREARADESADLLVPQDQEISGPLWISYDELMAAEDGTVEADPPYPDCPALREARGKDAGTPGNAPKRLKLVSLEPSCVPFLMPSVCCK